ncbi:hypothetical protein B0H13DRAFT_1899633 [Mycena leptocephala]|nr:hypothetical protein B0H13DRAFT_1899633 [Mycena leptocephala]
MIRGQWRGRDVCIFLEGKEIERHTAQTVLPSTPSMLLLHSWLAAFGWLPSRRPVLSVPSVDIEIRGSTRMARARPSARRKRREYEYEIDANARRNEEKGKDAMCGGAREVDVEVTAEG